MTKHKHLNVFAFKKSEQTSADDFKIYVVHRETGLMKM